MAKIKYKVKTVAIVYRKDTPKALDLAQEVADWLVERGISTYSHPQQRIQANIKRFPKTRTFKATDLVVVLGGDGTYLEAVRMLDGHKTPILGVNMGSLGFLTQIKVKDLYPSLDLALQRKLETRPRTMIQVVVQRKGKTRLEANALNDIVLERGEHPYLSHMDMFNGKNLVGRIKSDGLIVSTPTGSTAYNLAAGGPILHPHVRAITVTPICPHSLTNRPILFDDAAKLSFNLIDNSAFLSVDGIRKCEVNSEDSIVIKKSKCDHYVLRKPSDNYFNLLREKLKFSERD